MATVIVAPCAVVVAIDVKTEVALEVAVKAVVSVVEAAVMVMVAAQSLWQLYMDNGLRSPAVWKMIPVPQT